MGGEKKSLTEGVSPILNVGDIRWIA